MRDKMLSTEDIAKQLDVSPHTVRAWLRKGILKGIKVGGGKLWRISEENLEAFLEVEQNKVTQNS